MRRTLFGALALTLSLVATEAAAETPLVVLQTEAAKEPAVVMPVKPVRPTAAKMIKGAEKLVLKTVKLNIWKDHETGDRAVLWIDPLLAGGGKFRLQYKF